MANILITGAGSIIAIGYIQSLKAAKASSRLNTKIIAADISKDAAGLYMADKGYVVPKASHEKDYIAKIKEVCLKEKIDIIFIGSTQETKVLAMHKKEIEDETDAIVTVSNEKAIEISADKWRTQKFLEQNRLNYARSTVDLSQENIRKFVKQVGLPIVAKPRHGQNSIGVFVYRTLEEALHAINSLGSKDYLLQEYLPDEHGEFTVGILMERGKLLSSIALKRKLQPRWGVSQMAEPVDDKKITDYCAKAAEKLGVFGPCNFQLRIKDNKPVIFEINCRFSSTSHMRTLLGVNEQEILIRNLVLKEKVKKVADQKSKKGRVVRFVDDFLITDEMMERVD
ncbi:ATP-grasp domain-containing protein [Candidatus Woesearchaeota archaeon]|nr:ATP-grasp domain-containing protein [Candidatus Woesearchaeota archaeon]